MVENSELKIQNATAFRTLLPRKSLERERRCKREKNKVKFCNPVQYDAVSSLGFRRFDKRKRWYRLKKSSRNSTVVLGGRNNR